MKRLLLATILLSVIHPADAVAVVAHRFQQGIPDGSSDELQGIYKDQLGALAKGMKANSKASIDFNDLIALIQVGQNPNEQVGDATPLILACRAGDDVAAEQLLELGASAQSVFIDQATNVYTSPWFAALQLDKARHYMGLGWDPYYNWHRNHRRPLLERLLAKEVDISDCGGQGTALHEALKNGDKLLAAFLLERNIVIGGMQDRNGHTAFEASCRRCGGKTT